MDNSLNHRFVSFLKIYSRAAALAGMAVGALVLAGWAAESVPLISVFPGLVPMNPATAVAFIMCGASLSLRHRAGGRALGAARALGTLVFLIGVCRLAGYAGWDIGIDRILFSAKLESVPFAPNRMAPNTALNFVLLGLSLGMLDVEVGKRLRPAQYFTLGVAFFALLAVTGYAYSVFAFYRVTSYIPMAFNTALTFLLLTTGTLCARPDKGWMALVCADTVGGILARRLLPAAVLVPFGLGWLCLKGQLAGYYAADFGVSLLVLATMVAIMGFVLGISASLHHTDLKRRSAEEKIQALNQALSRNAAQLAAANKELEAFSYSISHDLRAPLRAINGFNRILEEDYGNKLEAAGRDCLQRVHNATRKMSELIDGLLNMARLTRQELRKETLNLSALAREIAEELRKIQPDRAAEFVIQEGLWASGDRALLRAVMENLLGNAWKYSSKKSSARIEIGMEQPQDGHAVYFVRDNGAGFNPAYGQKLFSVFQRLHSAEEFPGTGVGLATVQRIIQRHGGRIWAESVPNQGATFRFSLPLDG
jgi:signal transduction histidine kinase